MFRFATVLANVLKVPEKVLGRVGTLSDAGSWCTTVVSAMSTRCGHLKAT